MFLPGNLSSRDLLAHYKFKQGKINTILKSAASELIFMLEMEMF